MKKYRIPFSVFLFITLLTTVSCEKRSDDSTTVVPEVSIQITECSYNSVTFTVTPSGASKCAYLIIKDGEEIPDSESILENGTAINADRKTTCLAEGLSEDCSYSIFAAVANMDETAVTSEQFRTEVSPYDIDFTAIYLGGEYYGDWLGFGNDNFYVILSDKGMDENGKEYPGGNFLIIDLYSPLVSDTSNPAPSAGEYNADSSDEEFSINCGYSYYYGTDSEGTVCGKVNLSGGSLRISEKDKLYTIEADFTLDDGQRVHCKYEGPFVLPAYNEGNNRLPIIENDIKTIFTGAGATNYGNSNGACNIAVLLWDMEENPATGNLIAPGHVLKLDLMTDSANGMIEPGEYTVDEYGTFSPFTYIEGSIIEFYGIELPVGTYIRHYGEDGNVDGYGFVNSGKVTIGKNDNGYNFDIHLEMAGGYTLEATYSGEITITDEVQ